jgi:hypothetical protein
MARKQRVYADKLSARVDEKAKKLEDDAQKLALEVELLR